MVNFVNIPKELKTNASFCLWKLRSRKSTADFGWLPQAATVRRMP